MLLSGIKTNGMGRSRQAEERVRKFLPMPYPSVRSALVHQPQTRPTSTALPFTTRFELTNALRARRNALRWEWQRAELDRAIAASFT
jgi:hypothetical protein